MSEFVTINDFIRQRLKKLRLTRKIGMQRLAREAGIPYSSYACMESGQYGIRLENLSRILAVLRAEITDVWPCQLDEEEELPNPAHLMSVQEFRLRETMSLAKAEGAALFSVQQKKCSVLLYENLSDFLLDRLILYLEDGRRYQHGVWFDHAHAGRRFHLFLKAESCPDYVRKLARHYLSLWAHLFATPPFI